MEALSSSRFSSRFPTLLDPISKPPKPTRRHRRLLQTLASIPADAAAPSPSSPPAPYLSRLLAAALRGGRVRGELPDLASAGGAGIGTLLMSTTAAAVTKARESPYLLALAANPTFVSGMLAFAAAQAAKVVLTSVVERRWSPRMLCSSGGMPSSHSALCTALTASVALCHGVRDALFPVCLGFSLIVMYDATGVRRHAGMQAQVGIYGYFFIFVMYDALFPVCLGFSLIVMYDATGVRRHAGMQAQVLNKIVEDLFQGHPISERKLKELLGHTPSQVFAGAFLGILVAWFCCQGCIAAI